MGQAQMAKTKYTVSEYLEMEAKSEIRHEYYDGEIFAMAGTTMNHNRIVGRLRNLFERKFLPAGCDVFAENIKVEAIKNFYYPYPDVIVTCSPEDRAGTYIVKRPSILVEVLSKSSATYDRGFKLRRYKQIDSLDYYMLVSQNEHYVELYIRTDQPEIWTYQTFDNERDVIHFEKLDLEIPLSAIYENIVFIPDEETV
ncbi:Uma2 family endonuclease [Dyadobacter sp. CY323]|uniref:Uma2 family endonuclease n=1 Tax=Dyadobacter sp. CY323 TaxID=2907302 RepID=UPI001F21C8F2|nr:Uma2 family endonuclease [Dyadobacter sp. CY323]MCE6992836.1 Uma2 family endonuclease [Dyadobacter sp. CY323]